MGVEAAALAAERSARLQAAQDVRTLVSFDGGRTLSPFRGTFDKGSKPLAGYLAVKHMGYWADLFVSASNGIGDVQRRVEAGLDTMLRSAAPGIAASALNRNVHDILKPYGLHPALSESVGNRIGFSLDEGGALTRDSRHTLLAGEVYTLHVGAHDFAAGGAFASAMIAVTAKGCDIIHRSPPRP